LVKSTDRAHGTRRLQRRTDAYFYLRAPPSLVRRVRQCGGNKPAAVAADGGRYSRYTEPTTDAHARIMASWSRAGGDGDRFFRAETFWSRRKCSHVVGGRGWRDVGYDNNFSRFRFLATAAVRSYSYYHSSLRVCAAETLQKK